MFEAVQQSIAAALLDPERPVPAGLTAQGVRTPTKRFAVYRNNVVAGLSKALAARFPATERIVGEEFFHLMARAYVVARPPRSAVLTFYGDAFPEFIAQFEPARGLAYLPDVARLEAARTRAYHAADAKPLDPPELSKFAGDEISRLRFAAHPSAEIVRSPYPIVRIWAMNAGQLALGPIEDWREEDALVVRPALDVQVRALPAGGARFLALLFAGKTLAEATEAAHELSEDFDLAPNLAGLISSGTVIAVRSNEKPEP